MSSSQATPAPTQRLRHHGVPVRLLRLGAAGAILAAAAVAALNGAAYRALEAAGAAFLLERLFPGDSSASRDTFWIVTEHFAQGFRVSVECTSLILIAPLLILAAVMLAATRVRFWRLAVAIPVMLSIITVINELRLALIGFSSITWGMNAGYQISHTFVGSVLGIFGFVAGLATLLVISLGRRRKQRL